MAMTTIDKERRNAVYLKVEIIVGVILYLYLVLTYLHAGALQRNNPRLSFVEAINTGMSRVFTAPFEIFPLDGKLLLNLMLFTVLFLSVVAIAISNKALKKHDNPETVNGEAHLMNAQELKQYNLRFSAPLKKPENDGFNNMIISKDIRLAIDNKGTRRNCNILVIGGSGAGKSRFFAAPNILQYNCNFVITDPSGELLQDYAKALENFGYEVKVFNLTDVYRSNRYNPFHYIKEEKDVFTLVNTLIKNTTPSEGKAGDPFWENSEKLLLTALILYLWHVFPEEQQTFTNVVKLVTMAEVDENDATAKSPLDILFDDLEREDPENLAIKQYKKFKIGAGKTLKSILISVGVRLQSFDLSDIQYLTEKDDFEFERFADTKQALFVIIPTADTTFNFLVSLLYSQLFTSLYTYAETRAEYGWKASIDEWTNIKVEQAEGPEDSEAAKKRLEEFVAEIKQGVVARKDKQKDLYRVYTKKSRKLVGWRGTKDETKEFMDKLKNIKIEKCQRVCPNHVRLILDEFANIGQIPDFNEKLATMRKYEISCSIILQALSQLKDIYKDKWNTIVANCDTKLFLGCDDSETIEWMLKMLGKKTTTVENTSWQAGGSGSTSYNKSSLEVLTIDQISMMQDDECLVRIRGVRPYYGKKFELTNHKNYEQAHSLYGKFVIPISDDVTRRETGPLWKRKNNKAARDAAREITKGDPENSVQPHSAPNVLKENTPAPSSVIPTPTSVKNSARKQEAKEAAEAVKHCDNFAPEDSEDMIMQGLADAFGLKPNMDSSAIKESVDTIMSLMELPSGGMTYIATE